MEKITVVPLGPGSFEHLTLGALNALEKARKVILRTGRHGACEELERRNINFTTLDSLYEESADFDALNGKAAQTLWAAAVSGQVAYGVADPAADETVRELIRTAGPQRQVTVLAGVPLTAPCLCALGEMAIGRPLRILPATACPKALLTPSESILITELNSRLLAGEIKVWLMTLHNPELEVFFFPPGETAQRTAEKIQLTDLDRRKGYDHTCAVFVPAAPMLERERHDFFDLTQVMEKLRSPDGCPWDKEQTHETLRPYLLEEAYEAVSAIDEGDMDHVADELGDVLLQVVFHAEIARQHGEFDIRDVTTAICSKMISRHAHIFGQVKCDTAEQVLVSWDKQKRQERGLTSQAAVLADVPKHLPALMRAQKVKQKARQVGFDWDDPKEALNKVLEEAREVREELDKGADPGEELGDLLFAAANVARLCKKQPELLLQAAVDKFIKRFERMEKAIVGEGKALERLTLSEMDVYWEKEKLME
jgi:tetrapyrrole methylase family protein/MazG family protein